MDLDNFIIGKTKERRGEGRFGKKSNSFLTNIERKRCKKSSSCFPNIEDRNASALMTSELEAIAGIGFLDCC